MWCRLFCRAALVGDDYTWRWDTCVRDQGHATRVKSNFKQATFFGTSLSASRLLKRDAGHLPLLNDHGRSDGFILDLMRGDTSLSDIARRAATHFPTRFATEHDALARVRDLSIGKVQPIACQGQTSRTARCANTQLRQGGTLFGEFSRGRRAELAGIDDGQTA